MSNACIDPDRNSWHLYKSLLLSVATRAQIEELTTALGEAHVELRVWKKTLTIEAERYRQVFNHIRPHEALGMRRPVEVHQQDQHTQLTTSESEPAS